jgi:ribosomal protein L22
MADEKDKKEKTEAKDSKESKATEAKAEKSAAKPAAKKEAKPKAEKKPAAKKDSKDGDEKPAKKPAKKAAAKKEPKADAEEKPAKADKAPKADKDGDEKPAKKRRRSRGKKADAKDAKPARRRRAASDEVPIVRASAKYVRIAPRKARLVADQVRGLHIEQARALLAFSPRDAARDIHKLIDSAAANAENNHDLVGDEMRISTITVDEGPTLRRFRPRALGRATPINKRTSHIAVALTPVEDD